MKIKVVKEFRDKDCYTKIYEVDGVYEFEDERAKDIIARGLGVAERVRPRKNDQQGIYKAETE